MDTALAARPRRPCPVTAPWPRHRTPSRASPGGRSGHGQSMAPATSVAPASPPRPLRCIRAVARPRPRPAPRRDSRSCDTSPRKSTPNGVQMQQNFTEIFYGPEDQQWAKEAPGGAPRGARPTRARQGALARPGGLCPPRWPPAAPLYTINSQIF